MESKIPSQSISLANKRPAGAGKMSLLTACSGSVRGWFVADWLLTILLLGVAFSFEFLPPFNRSVSFDPSINYPYSPNNTVPSWSLILIAMVFPTCVMTAFYVIAKKFLVPEEMVQESREVIVRNHPARDTRAFVFFSRKVSAKVLHLCVLGLFLALSLTYFTSNCMKLLSGRPRPDFVSRCKPLDLASSPLVCQTDEKSKVMCDGRKSFPSGHTSCNLVYPHYYFIRLFFFM